MSDINFFLFVIAFCCVSKMILVHTDDLFPVSIIHFNDFHARFEETNDQSTTCKIDEGQKCIGGYARVVTMVKQLLEIRKDSNPIYLNAGDNFQGTLWYNIHRWNATSYFLNLLPADAITLGNHEFDHKIEGVIPFMETINSTIVIANIDDSEEPSFQGKYQKSKIITKYDRDIGIIGVMLQTTDKIADTGKLKFFNEAQSVKEEAAKLKSKGVDIIIVLSHSGLDVDAIIAAEGGPYIDVIVGGHSHTFLYTGENPPGPDKVYGDYPTVVTQSDGHKVLIVQASAYTKYLGDITVYFDNNGNVVSWEGAPIFLDNSVTPDPDILEELIPWKVDVDVEGLKQIGVSKVNLLKSGCNSAECNLGSLISDSFVHAYVDRAEEDSWTYASIAITNVGGIRTTLSTGLLTYGDLVTTLPFDNTVDCLELRGDHVLEMLEYSVTHSYSEEYFSGGNMLQVSGLKLVFNVTNRIGKRVISADVLCNKCLIPVYEPLDLTKMYRLIISSFIVAGGDGFTVISENLQNHEIGPIDIDVFVKYVQRLSPIIAPVTGRITVLT